MRDDFRTRSSNTRVMKYRVNHFCVGADPCVCPVSTGGNRMSVCLLSFIFCLNVCPLSICPLPVPPSGIRLQSGLPDPFPTCMCPDEAMQSPVLESGQQSLPSFFINLVWRSMSVIYLSVRLFSVLCLSVCFLNVCPSVTINFLQINDKIDSFEYYA